MDKKEQILNAAITIFSNFGYHNSKITDIAELAGVGTGTTYLYFKSKEQILEEIFIKSWTNIENFLIELALKKKLSSSDKIKSLIENIIELIIKKKDVAKLILFEVRLWNNSNSDNINKIVNNTKSILIDIIKLGSKNGEFRKNLNPELASIFFIGGLWYLMAHWSENFNNLTSEQIKKEANKLIINAFE